MNGLQGVCCANFSSAKRNWTTCQKMWCVRCYTPHLEDSFPIRLPTDDDGEVCVKPGDEERFNFGHEGAHLSHPLQCDLCWFHNLKGKDPVWNSPQDKLLNITIRRINLLSMWRSELLTTDAHRRTIIKGIKALNLVGLTPSYPSLERFKKGTRSDLSLLSKPGCDL